MYYVLFIICCCTIKLKNMKAKQTLKECCPKNNKWIKERENAGMLYITLFFTLSKSMCFKTRDEIVQCDELTKISRLWTYADSFRYV